jgi:hypothetical protein
MGEISAASNEQSLGVSQVGQAVTQMDQVTQENAALVEQMAAAASSLKSQAQELVHTVAAFKLDGSATSAPVPVRSPVQKPFSGNDRRTGQSTQTSAKSKPGSGSAAKSAQSIRPTPKKQVAQWETS